MRTREKHEAVDVHTQSVGEVSYHGPEEARRDWIAAEFEADSTAKHYKSFGQSEVRVRCEGRATIYLSVADAVQLRDMLTRALAEAAHPSALPVGETVG